MGSKDLNFMKEHDDFLKRKSYMILVLLILLVISSIYALTVGSIDIGFDNIIRLFTHNVSPRIKTTILNIRLPRLLSAILVGASLASSGAVMQCVLKNPLASASTLGVSQGAAFGAAFGIVIFGGGVVNSANATSAITINNPYIVTLSAFFFSSISTLFIVLISQMKKDIGPSGLVLAGVALSSLFSGGSTLLQYFTDDTKLGAIVFWTFGNLGSANWKNLVIICIFLFLGLLYFIMNRWNYNAMISGADVAESLGVNTRKLMLTSMIISSLLASISVSFVGIINFVGLVAPHIVRRLVGNDYRYLIPASAIAGALLLVLADIVAKSIIPPVILPIGALTSFLGAPMFLFLLFKGGHNA